MDNVMGKVEVLLEYQFTCHNKFKNSVNALCSKDLRLNPIGRDKCGCAYWLQIDDDANLRLYRENQDEETWMLIAKNRDELVKIINNLKNGDEITGINDSLTNEESNSADNTSPVKNNKSEVESNEEFLSPESEADNDDEKRGVVNTRNNTTDVNCDNKSDSYQSANKSDSDVKEPSDKNTRETVDGKDTTSSECINQNENCAKEQVGSTIEEPVMLVTGEGDGVECESFSIFGEEIIEPIMFVWGEGSGESNCTGNPEINENLNSVEDNNEDAISDNISENYCDYTNGEISETALPVASGNKSRKHTRSSNKLKLKSNSVNPTVSKRVFNKKCKEDIIKSESYSKKPCIWYTQDEDNHRSDIGNETDNDKDCCGSKEDSDKSHIGSEDKNLSDNEIKEKNVKRKNKTKIRTTKIKVDNQLEIVKSRDEINVVEKRKSSISSSDCDKKYLSDEDTNELLKEQIANPSSLESVKGDSDLLPTKKLKLQNSEENDCTQEELSSQSNQNIASENIDIEHKTNEHTDSITFTNQDSQEFKNEIQNNTTVDSNAVQDVPMIKRKKIKVSRNKYKQAKFKKPFKQESCMELNNDNTNSNQKSSMKSLKRSLIETYKSEKKSSESLSEDENEVPQTGGKRLKIKPKKIILSARKNIEAKRMTINSSDDSEEETLLQKKDKDIEQNSKKMQELDTTPVRQSRRIAQMKIKEEAERRHMEEVALRELKKIHKKKIQREEKEEEEWVASAVSSEEEEHRDKRRRAQHWHTDDSSRTSSDSDSDEPLFEPEEPDLDFSKSDHEFSPESDLEDGEPVEPLRRARTLDEGEDDGYCVHCGSGEQPEWILLCDNCNAGYHASCLKPVLFLIPEGDWFCPPCQHAKLITALEEELVKYDDLLKIVEEEKQKRKEQEIEEKKSKENESNNEKEPKSDEAGSSSEYSSSSSTDGAVYRLRERRQLPVSYRAREYDRLMSSAIKEEYVEPTSSAGNQGRGKDISTIIEAAEEEKLKAEREGQDQSQFMEIKKLKKKMRRKPRKLNSLEVPSEDDDETDEDFKDTGMYSSSEDISSDADGDSNGDSNNSSSDSLPIRRSNRSDRKDRRKIVESPEIKKKKGVFNDTSSESSGTKDWSQSKKKLKHKKKHKRFSLKKTKRKKKGLTQYDAEGNVIRARVTYGGLSGDDDENDWSPKHRTRQKKIDYTEMPNTESEDEMHKSSGKHMPDSSDEFRLEESDVSSSDSDCRKRKKSNSENSDGEKHKEALIDLIKKTAFVPLEKLPDDVTRAKQEALEACLSAQAANNNGDNTMRAVRGRGSRGGRNNRGTRGIKRGGKTRDPSAVSKVASENTDETLSKLVGVKIKDLTPNFDGNTKPIQLEREKKRLEKEARQAEKEARKLERLQKKEEKEKLKEQRAKEREEKRLARLALQESRRQRREMGATAPVPVYGTPAHEPRAPLFPRLPTPHAPPRLQVRPELQGMRPDLANVRAPRPPPHLDPTAVMREGTLSVAGSPQPFKPNAEEPSIITRMPHMISQQYRTPMMYPPGNAPYGHPRGASQNMSMYMHHQSHNMNHAQGMVAPVPNRHQYHVPGQNYYSPQIRGVPPGYPGPPHAQPLQQIPRATAPTLAPVSTLTSAQSLTSASPLAPTASLTPAPTLPPPGVSPNEGVIKIKSEIKTEPDFLQDSESPSTTLQIANRNSPTKDEAPRVSHPKIKHTENKDRKPRYPLGPYAPQYGPYGPYAPPSTGQSDQTLIGLQQRPLGGPPSGQLPHHLPPGTNVHHFMPPSIHDPTASSVVDQSRIPPHRALHSPHIDRSNATGSPHANTHSSTASRLTAHSQTLPPSSHYTPPPMNSQHQSSVHPPHQIIPMRSHAMVSTPSPSSVSTIASSRATHTPPQNVASSIPQSAHFAALRRLNPEAPSGISSIKQLLFPGGVHTKPQIAPPRPMLSPSSTPPINDYTNTRNLGPIVRQLAGDALSHERNATPVVDSHKVQQVPTAQKTPGDDSNSSTGESRVGTVHNSDNSSLNRENPTLPYPTSLIKTETDDSHTEHQQKMELSNVHHELQNQQSENVPVEETAPSEEISVFGGLVSYFSSQREDDIDS
ncbi:Remodeling and spacing factor 1 [Eumeta japonica]|uniref:Remodeling and spacing factor 1 n=1 Tax=Eumeta variegata TaxID=151549 RepID=A0A4C1X953_EUMVA|nr:Remodeling and spacing factor 1 [Eumeta japonica]